MAKDTFCMGQPIWINSYVYFLLKANIILYFQVMVERKCESGHHLKPLVICLCHSLYIDIIKILCVQVFSFLFC